MTTTTTLEPLVDLLNSCHVADGDAPADDQLADARAAGWLDGGPPEDAAPLAAVRDGLRTLASLNNDLEADPTALARAASALAATPVRVDLGGPDAPPALRPAGDRGGRTLAHAVTAYLAARADGRWDRVKLCAAPDCRWAYVDGSRNRSRRWCDMAACGNRAKNRAWRARAADGAGA